MQLLILFFKSCIYNLNSSIYKREIKEYTRKLTSGGCYTFLTLLHEGEEEMLLNKYNPLPKETILLKTV